MRLIRIGGIVLLAAVVAAVVSTVYYVTRPVSTPQVGRGPLAQGSTQDGPQNAASKAAGAVVRVETGLASPASGPTPGGAGSGVIIDSRGYVLTAQALVSGAPRISVTVPGQKPVDARVVGSDPLTGVSLLKIDGSGLKTLSLGNGGTLETGSGIVVMAAPPAFELAVGAVATAHASTGVEDAAAPGHRRVLNDIAALDIAPREGQLGAPLLDGAGRVLGVVVVAASQTWAADIANAQPAVSQLQDTGRVAYPWLNFDYQQLSATEAGSRGVGAGVLLLKVASGSSAEQAGLAAGDVVTSVAGQALDPGHPLERVLRGQAVHQTVSVAVHPGAGGNDRTVSLTVDLVGQ
ncbi:MAG TPA: S1C family serine protease [Candidatus Dormibacteraeota bacterium]|nr:S1C family serine protease [Candidatus Dormibacteraeota bacterium]